MSDDTPTERMAEVSEELVEEKKKSRLLLIILIALVGLLVVALIVTLAVLLTRGSGGPDTAPTPTVTASETPTPTPTESESATPTPTPTPTPTQAPPPPPPPDNTPAFTSFNFNGSVFCNASFPPGYVPPVIAFNYQTKNASSVWFLFGEGDAANAAAFPMPLSGNQDDVYGGGSSIPYPCYQPQEKFTLTIVGTNGQHVSRTFTVKNVGDTQ